MTARCPSLLALEAHLLDPAASPVAAHLAGCEACRARVAEMERQGDEFRRFVYPATLDAVVAPRRPWWRLPLLLAPALAAAGLIVAVLPGPPADYVGTKGAPLGLQLFAEGAASALDDGAPVRPDANVRFRLQTARPCLLWLFSVDEAGQVSRLLPREGEAGLELRGAQVLPGGARLDGRPGVERFYAVCAAQPLPFEQVARAAGAASGGAQAVRAAARLEGLPGDVTQASLLVEKRW